MVYSQLDFFDLKGDTTTALASIKQFQKVREKKSNTTKRYQKQSSVETSLGPLVPAFRAHRLRFDPPVSVSCPSHRSRNDGRGKGVAWWRLVGPVGLMDSHSLYIYIYVYRFCLQKHPAHVHWSSNHALFVPGRGALTGAVSPVSAEREGCPIRISMHPSCHPPHFARALLLHGQEL